MPIVKFLKDNLPNNDFIHNKSVGSICIDGHLFPDILFDCGFYHLIVEIDEFQHKISSYICEEQRMRDIIAKTGLPCIVIIYNPNNKKSDKDIHGFKAEYLFYD